MVTTMGRGGGKLAYPTFIYSYCTTVLEDRNVHEPIEPQFGMVSGGEPKESCIRWTFALVPRGKCG